MRTEVPQGRDLRRVLNGRETGTAIAGGRTRVEASIAGLAGSFSFMGMEIPPLGDEDLCARVRKWRSCSCSQLFFVYCRRQIIFVLSCRWGGEKWDERAHIPLGSGKGKTFSRRSYFPEFSHSSSPKFFYDYFILFYEFHFWTDWLTVDTPVPIHTD